MTKKYLNLEILQYFKNKISDLFCKISIYDADGDGIIDNSKSLDGHSYAEIEGMIDDVIEDGSTTSDSTWSSQKISEELKQKANTTDIPEVPLANASKSGLNRAKNNGLIQNSDGTFELDTTKTYVFNTVTKNIFVDSVNGDDLNDGTLNKPFKTLSKAVSVIPLHIKGENIIQLKNGTYTLTNVSGFIGAHNGDTTANGITIKAYETSSPDVTINITSKVFIGNTMLENINFTNVKFVFSSLSVIDTANVCCKFTGCSFTFNSSWNAVFRVGNRSTIYMYNCQVTAANKILFMCSNGIVFITLYNVTGTCNNVCNVDATGTVVVNQLGTTSTGLTASSTRFSGSSYLKPTTY